MYLKDIVVHGVNILYTVSFWCQHDLKRDCLLGDMIKIWGYALQNFTDCKVYKTSVQVFLFVCFFCFSLFWSFQWKFSDQKLYSWSCLKSIFVSRELVISPDSIEFHLVSMNIQIVRGMFYLHTCTNLFCFPCFFFQFYWDMTDIQHYLSLRCIAWWFALHTSWNDCHNNLSEYPLSRIDTTIKEIER